MLIGYNSQQDNARFDFENTTPLTPDLENVPLAKVVRHLPDLDALLVSDQFEVNGIISPCGRASWA
jgi:hypothetical protein